MPDRDEFFVGYKAQAPPGLARFLKAVVGLVLLLGAALAVALASLQAPFDPGLFEYGTLRRFEGTIQEDPHPLLRVDRPGAGDGERSRYLLVAEGKHGAGPEVEGLDGRRVALDGTLVYRPGQTMVLVASGSVEPLAGAAAGDGAPVELGPATLRGEIVDSKCYFGVMKPGRGKPHRACATLCIRGGIPPVLRVETEAGEERLFLLVGERGEALNDRILHLVARPVEIPGRLSASGDLVLLRADPSKIRVLPPTGG